MVFVPQVLVLFHYFAFVNQDEIRNNPVNAHLLPVLAKQIPRVANGTHVLTHFLETVTSLRQSWKFCLNLHHSDLSPTLPSAILFLSSVS